MHRQSVLPKPLDYRTLRNEVAGLHRSGAGGRASVNALSRVTDQCVRTSFESTEGAESTLLVVVALGGYGRGELCFGSDIDLMVLAPDEAAKVASGAVMRQFLHRLLDAGMDVGHSFRTIEDCLDARTPATDIWLSILDARLLCGNRRTFRTFTNALHRTIRTSDPSSFAQDVISLQETRHEKYGRSTKLLEPNLKNSSGGLRDLHSVAWLLRGTGLERIGVSTRHGTLDSVLASASIRAIFPPRFPAQARRSLDFMLRVRNEMHLMAGGLHDTLEFSMQSKLASSLGFGFRASSTAVERFMREYYESANTIAEMSARSILWARDRWLHQSGTSDNRQISRNLRMRSGKVDLVTPNAPLTTATVLDAFRARAEEHADFSFHLEDAIHRRLATTGVLRNPDSARTFWSLFQRPGTADALRLMNRLGILERWIPEWRPLVRFFQHNQYHFFTADEHTLTVIANAEALEKDSGVFGLAFHALPRRDTLLFACLLHDIAKPQRLEDHEVAGVRIAQRVLKRLGAGEISDDVAFLVRHHLDMEQVAFRRNVSDASTISDFASRFPRPELLDYLLCLTVADLSAVNRNVWTEWKAALLADLYRRTRALLRPNESPITPTRSVDAYHRALERRCTPEEIQEHGSLLSYEGYQSVFTADEVVDHLHALRNLDTVSAHVQHWSEYTEITVITHDAPFVLSRSCGVLSANDANIIDAQIFTRDDGVVIDRFRVVDAVGHGPLIEERCRKIGEELRDVFSGRTDLAHLIERHRRRWKRKAHRHNPNIRIDVEFEDHPAFTIIDVYGVDVLGFLYRVTERISSLGLGIHFAKISTRGDGIVDSFYVLDRKGDRLSDPDRRSSVRASILKTIRELADSELVTTKAS